MIARPTLSRTLSRLLLRLEVELVVICDGAMGSFLASSGVVCSAGWVRCCVAYRATHETTRQWVLSGMLFQAIVDSEVVELGQIFMHA